MWRYIGCMWLWPDCIDDPCLHHACFEVCVDEGLGIALAKPACGGTCSWTGSVSSAQMFMLEQVHRASFIWECIYRPLLGALKLLIEVPAASAIMVSSVSRFDQQNMINTCHCMIIRPATPFKRLQSWGCVVDAAWFMSHEELSNLVSLLTRSEEIFRLTLICAPFECSCRRGKMKNKMRTLFDQCLNTKTDWSRQYVSRTITRRNKIYCFDNYVMLLA